MRQMSGDQSAAFRAVVVYHYPERLDHRGEPVLAWHSTAYYGPYANAGTARARITRASRRYDPFYRDRSPTVTGHVERSSVAWEVVE